jgi:hypothetical protein
MNGGIFMRCALVIVTVLCIGLFSVSLFAAEQAKSDQSLICPRSLTVEIAIRTIAPVSGWEAIPAKSTFTLAIKENVVRDNSMICHYTNGTVDYNLAKVFPKGKNCLLAPNQSFRCQ